MSLAIKLKKVISVFFLISLIVTGDYQPVSAGGKTVEVEADGEAFFSDNETAVDFKIRLLAQVKEKAVEIAGGSMVKKNTIIHNREAISADITTSTRGEVVDYSELAYRSAEPGSKGYLKIKAKVLVSEHFRDPNMKLNARINKSRFVPQEKVELEISTNFDAYLTIINVYEDDSVAIIFPNSLISDNFLPAGQKMVFPSEDLKRRGISLLTYLPPDKNRTVEYIRIFAAKKNVPLFDPDFKQALYKFIESRDTKTMGIFLERIYKKIDADQITDQSLQYIIEKD